MSTSEGNAGEHNPVAQVVCARTLQVSVLSVVALLILKRTLPPEQYRRVRRLSGPLLTGGLSAYFAATFSPTTRFPGDRFLARLPQPEGRAQVALTFDDGPHPETTPRLLDALTTGGAKATFFFVAERAQKYPDLVRRVFDEGHAIGLHGLSHRTLALDNENRIERDLSIAQRQLEEALGAGLPSRLFRPPYGFKSWTMARTTARLGWTTIGWSCDPRDYDGIPSARIFENLRRGLRSGDIVLLHERPGRFDTIDAVPGIIRLCGERRLACTALRD